MIVVLTDTILMIDSTGKICDDDSSLEELQIPNGMKAQRKRDCFDFRELIESGDLSHFQVPPSSCS